MFVTRWIVTPESTERVCAQVWGQGVRLKKGQSSEDSIGDLDSREYARRVVDSRGGKLTLRLVSSDGAAAEYAGELTSGEKVCSVRIRIDAGGRVDVESQIGAAPDWLAALTRSVMRTAWRAAVAGTPWPRRLSRWRPAAEDTGSE